MRSTNLADKLCPPGPPQRWADPRPAPLRLTAPGRPSELDVVAKTRRSIPRGDLENPRKRARLLHTFCHHELQAAELMAWAILAFPETPSSFRRGLLGICLDEIRHIGMYREHMETLGFEFGDFPVRDWFWQRVSACTSPVQFTALLGIGFEGGNLDHTRRFAAWFRAIGDEAGARLHERVGDEEVPHVRFAAKWFREWTGGLNFETWRTALVEPLTPSMMRGTDVDEERRELAGLPREFIDTLRGWSTA